VALADPLSAFQSQAQEKYNIEKDIAAYIKKEFDKKYTPTWHCIVGRNFGSYVTHETKHFIYFYLGACTNSSTPFPNPQVKLHCIVCISFCLHELTVPLLCRSSSYPAFQVRLSFSQNLIANTGHSGLATSLWGNSLTNL